MKHITWYKFIIFTVALEASLLGLCFQPRVTSCDIPDIRRGSLGTKSMLLAIMSAIKIKEAGYLTIICRRRSAYCGIIRLGDYSTIFPKPKENNNYCFSIIAQMIIRANALSFFFSSETSKLVRWPFRKLASASVL